MPHPGNNDHTGPYRILIIGGGIAGIVLASLLERQGHDVTLAERSTGWKPAGGGITLTLNGVRALRSIGLLPGIVPYANEVRTINITDHKGVQLSSFGLSGYAARYAPTYTIHRHRLHQVLLAHLRYTRLYTGAAPTSIDDRGAQVWVELSNGHSGHYDLVVGCDGINSMARKHLFPTAQKKYAGYSCWRFVVHDVPGIASNAITEMWGRGKRFGIVPLGGGVVHCFASVNAPAGLVAHARIGLDAFRDIYKAFAGDVPLLLAGLSHPGQLMYAGLEDITLPQWGRGRVVLAGDAAHGMTPNMTQGASMAIEDAIALAGELGGGGGVAAAARRFCEGRKKRVDEIQRRSNLLGRIGQMEGRFACALRNFAWAHIPAGWMQNDLKKLLVSGVPHWQCKENSTDIRHIEYAGNHS